MARTGRPATGVTPLRNIRVPDELWDAAKALAAQRDETVTDVILRGLRRYVASAARERPAGTP